VCGKERERKQEREPGTYTSAKEPYISVKESYISAKERYISVKEPCTSAKEPYISAKEPYISVKEPYISAKEPCICIQNERENLALCSSLNIYVVFVALYFCKRALCLIEKREKEPRTLQQPRHLCGICLDAHIKYISAKEPYISAKEPYTSAKEPYISVKEPCISVKEPYIYAKEPYICIQNKRENLALCSSLDI